jgi:hypothetical protein
VGQLLYNPHKDRQVLLLQQSARSSKTNWTLACTGVVSMDDTWRPRCSDGLGSNHDRCEEPGL